MATAARDATVAISLRIGGRVIMVTSWHYAMWEPSCLPVCQPSDRHRGNHRGQPPDNARSIDLPLNPCAGRTSPFVQLDALSILSIQLAPRLLHQVGAAMFGSWHFVS